MITQYHEMSAVTGVGQPGNPVTLDDLHRRAWGLYTGTGNMVIPKGVERPFTFRADELPRRPGMYLFVIRSGHSFQNAREVTLDLSEGTSLSLEFPFAPFQRVSTDTGKTRRITPPNDEWHAIASRLLERAGMQVEELSWMMHAKTPYRRGKPRIPQAMVTAQVTVQDPLAAVEHWTHGVAPMRAYGMGQLTILPDRQAAA